MEKPKLKIGDRVRILCKCTRSDCIEVRKKNEIYTITSLGSVANTEATLDCGSFIHFAIWNLELAENEILEDLQPDLSLL